MRREQIQVERILVALGWEASEELLNAAVEVSNRASTSAFARAAVEVWIRSRGIRDVLVNEGDFGFWEFCVHRVAHVLGVDDPAVDASITASLEAVVDFLEPY